MGRTQYEVDFKYDTERDNPRKIANEMRDSYQMKLSAEQLDAIERRIEESVRRKIAKKSMAEGT